MKRFARQPGVVSEPLPMTSDAELYRRWLAERDEGSFRDLALRHADLVLDVAWRLSGDRARAEDSVQEALLSLALDATDRPVVVGVRAWLARKAIGWGKNSRASDAARARRESIAGGTRKEVDVRAPDVGTTDAVRAALDRIPGEDAAVLTLRYLHGLEYPELAAVLDVAEPTARVRVHRALAELRLRMGGESAPDDRLALALGAVPAVRFVPIAADALVEGVLARARVVPLTVTPPGAGPAAAAVARSATRVLPWAFAAGGAALGVAALLFFHSNDDAGSASVSVASGEPTERPGLRVAPPLARRPASGAETAQEPPPDADPGPPFPAPRRQEPAPPAAPAAPRPPRMQVRVHLVLLGTGERLPIQVVESAGEESRPDRPAEEITVGVLGAGHEVWVRTEDLRGRTGSVSVRVPDPVPSDLDVFVPARDDPRLSSPVIRVTDAKTGNPLPHAVLEPGRTAPWLKPVLADEQGRIHVPLEVLRWLQRDIGMNDIGLISEPGHIPKSWNGLLRFSDEWAAWSSSGEYRVALDPIGEKELPLEIHLIGADGHPVAGALLLFRAVWWGNQFSSLPARTDDEGRAKSLTYPAFVVDVFVRGSFVASWLLARDRVREATPEGAVRELRLPALAPVRVEIVDAGSSPLEGLLRMPNAEAIDAGAIAAAKGKGFSPGDDFYAPGEPVPVVAVPDHPTTFEFLAPVGRDVEISFRRSDPKDWIRTLSIRAASAEPLKITRAWNDLANPVGR